MPLITGSSAPRAIVEANKEDRTVLTERGLYRFGPLNETGGMEMFSHTHRLAQAGFVALALAFTGLTAPAFAAGGDSGSNNNTPECKKGMHYDEKSKICVPNSALNDQQLYRQGHDLALAGRYESALDALEAVRN